MKIKKSFLAFFCTVSLIAHTIIVIITYYCMKTDDDPKFPSLFQTILDWKGLAVFSFFFSITLILYLLFALGVGHTIAFLNVRIGNVLNIISYLKITLLFVTTYIPRNEYYYANFVMLVIFIILLFVWLILISIAENKPRLEQNSHDYLLIVLAALVGICGFLYLVFGAINKNLSLIHI